MDWIGVLSVGAVFSGTVVAYQSLLHNRNVKAKDEDRLAHEKAAAEIRARFDTLDAKHEQMRVRVEGDINGLTVQLGATVAEVERRFLPRHEHAETIAGIRADLKDLVNQLSQLNTHLFDLASRGRPRST